MWGMQKKMLKLAANTVYFIIYPQTEYSGSIPGIFLLGASNMVERDWKTNVDAGFSLRLFHHPEERQVVRVELPDGK